MNILVGIDFGTTNTVVCYYENNKVKTLLDGISKIIPSQIAKYNDKYYCGNYIPIEAENIIINFKNDNNIELLIIFFSHIRELIIKCLGNRMIDAVITVPSNFDNNQRNVIKSAFNHVNINVIRLINEPTAAALAYGLNNSETNEIILVVDTGGGTMDFTILEKTDDLFQIIYSDGINDLGGNNFTNVIINDIKKNNKLSENNYKLWGKAEQIKQKLAIQTNVNTMIDGTNYSITLKKFNQLSNQLINMIEDKLNFLCDNYKFNYVVMVGGSSRLLLLQECIINITKIKPWLHTNLETVVAEGACLYANIIENKLVDNNDIVLLDIVPLSLGVELIDETFSIIIPKNTPLPVKKTVKYTTDCNNLLINIYQGERKIAKNNTHLGVIQFDKVTLSGVPIIEITFKIDINAMIEINVIDIKSGIEKIFLLKDIPKLDNKLIDDIVNNAFTCSETDTYELIKKQSTYQIQTLIENAKFNLEINTLISCEEKQTIQDRMNHITFQLDKSDNTRLLEFIAELETTYNILTNTKINDEYHVIDKVTNEDKNNFENKVKLLLSKKPELENLLNPILEKLSYNNITQEYIDEKIILLNELENLSTKNYKTELWNLCLYLKSEIQFGNIVLSKENHEILVKSINTNIDLLNEKNDIDWENQLNQLNIVCELL